MSTFRQDIEAALPALRRYARAVTRDADIADDLVQDTLVRALRSEDLFHDGNIRSWLYTILTNLNRNRLRLLARRPNLLSISESDVSDMTGSEGVGRDIERALDSLVEDQRVALLLVVLEGMTYREVAEVQGVPIGTVMSRLARARMQIKAFLDGERPGASFRRADRRGNIAHARSGPKQFERSKKSGLSLPHPKRQSGFSAEVAGEGTWAHGCGPGGLRERELDAGTLRKISRDSAKLPFRGHRQGNGSSSRTAAATRSSSTRTRRPEAVIAPKAFCLVLNRPLER